MDRSKYSAAPMDFAWQNSHGPVDESSGFAKLGAQAQQRQQQDTHAGVKRTFSNFNIFSKQSAPSLRNPMSQPHFFSNVNHQSEPNPNRNPSFTTPRKLDVDFSSGGETPNSPDTPADSDATPDRTERMGFRDAFARLGGGSSQTRNTQSDNQEAPKERKNSIFRSLTSASPGRGEVARGTYSNKAANKIVKRRRKEATQSALIRRKNSTASDSESDPKSPSPRKASSSSKSTTNPNRPSTLFSLFSFIETHPNLPHILSFYAQLLLNVFLVFFFIYVVWSFWTTIRSDVDEASHKATAETLAEMALCAKSYRENRCAPREQRVPAMEAVCGNWEKCMDQDPRSVGRARVSAHTFAEIFNSFVEPISYKAMIFTFVLVFGCLAVSNFAFGFYRSHRAADHGYAAAPPPPPTPQRHFSGEQQNFYTPYRNQVQFEPGPAYAGGIEQGSPTRRLQYY